MHIGIGKSRSIWARLLVFLLVFSLVLPGGFVKNESAYAAEKPLEAPRPLSDIDTSYAKREIEALAGQGVLAGYTDGTFRPKQAITRAELAKILAVMLSLPQQPDKAGQFSDIGERSWYRGYVGALAEAGIVQGTSRSKFSPDGQVTREQMVVFFIRALGLEEKAKEKSWDAEWSDGKQISSWAKPAVDLAAHLDFVNGIAGVDKSLRFEPKTNADRQAVARLAYEFVTNAELYLERLATPIWAMRLRWRLYCCSLFCWSR